MELSDYGPGGLPSSPAGLNPLSNYYSTNNICVIFSRFFIGKISESIHAENVSGVIKFIPKKEEQRKDIRRSSQKKPQFGYYFSADDCDPVPFSPDLAASGAAGDLLP